MKRHLSCLDGVRGCLALWVFWGHITAAVGVMIPVLSGPSQAVDLFMLLSGFLMAWHWLLGDNKPGELDYSERTVEFWIRRFFRVAPLYYVLFACAVILDHSFMAAKMDVRHAFPYAGPDVSHGPQFTFDNISAHLSFVFGFVPRFAENNALPDWSLSLEMQFYLLFPSLITLIKPRRILYVAGAAVVVSALAAKLFGYRTPYGVFTHFPQPSFILFKLHVFIAGMAIGWLGVKKDELKHHTVFYLSLALILAFLPGSVAVIALLIAAMILTDSPPIAGLARFFGLPPLRMLGDLSYAVYLIHLFPVYYFVSWAHRQGWFDHKPPIMRFIIVVSILTPLIYAAAFVLHHLVEKPGIHLGKRVTGWLFALERAPARPRWPAVESATAAASKE